MMLIYMPQFTKLIIIKMVQKKVKNALMKCLQSVHGVHHLRNILLFWEAPPHDQGSGGYIIDYIAMTTNHF